MSHVGRYLSVHEYTLVSLYASGFLVVVPIGAPPAGLREALGGQPTRAARALCSAVPGAVSTALNQGGPPVGSGQQHRETGGTSGFVLKTYLIEEKTPLLFSRWENRRRVLVPFFVVDVRRALG